MKIPVTREGDSEPGLWLVGVFRQVTRSPVLSEDPFKHSSKSNLSTACPGENVDLKKTVRSAHRSVAKSQIKGSLGGGQAPAFLPLNPFPPSNVCHPSWGSRAWMSWLSDNRSGDTGQGRYPGSLAGLRDPTPGLPKPHSMEPVRTILSLCDRGACAIANTWRPEDKLVGVCSLLHVGPGDRT